MTEQMQSPGHLTLKGTGIWSELFFTWIKPVLSYGSKHILQQEDIPRLDPNMHSMKEFLSLSSNLQEEFNKENKNREGMSLVRAMFRTCKKLIYPVLITAVIVVTISMSIPYVTDLIIKYIEGGEKQVSKGILYVGGILLLKFVQNVAENRLFYNMTVIGYSLCNTLSVCIFEKATKYPTLCSKKYTIAQLINYSQVDAQRLTYLGFYTTAVLFIPFQLGVGIFLLYNFIGLSFLAGFGIIVVIGIVVFLVNKLNTVANDALLKAKDKRMNITNEIFNQIRFIKANAWEKYFFNKLNRARNLELSKLQRVSLYSILSIFFLWVTIPLILSSIFGMYTALGNKLTAQTAFTTIVLFNVLQFPLRTLPEAVSQLNQIWVSVRRIEKFLAEQDIDRSYIESSDGGLTHNAIEIRKGTFYWEEDEKKKEDQQQDKDKEKLKKKQQKEEKKKSIQQKSLSRSEIIPDSQSQSESQIKKSLLSDSTYQQEKRAIATPHIKALKGINVEIKKGKFTIILGNIGAGKSSLLYSIVGEMKPFPESGAHVDLNGSVALVVQKAWMLSKSIEENILMTQEKNNTLFEQSVRYSCLADDLKQLPDGDKTTIGEKGINLSGGQKARVSLARALYSNKDIYLLDDIISAVDVHVGNAIIKDCLIGYLKSKTRVLVTHAISYAKYADQIIIMRKGQIVERGSYQEVKHTTYFKEIQSLEQPPIQQPKKSSEQIPPNIPFPQNHDEQIPSETAIKDVAVHESTTNKLVEELMMPEDRVRGEVDWKTYKTYIKLNGGWYFVLGILVCMSCWIVLSTLANIQIEKWCENPEASNKSLYIFIGFSVASAFFAFGRAFILVFSGIRQGRIAHKKMIKGLMYASIPQFYDRIPIGRILNRVSKDLKELDQDIAYSIGNTIVALFTVLGNLTICVYASTPYILIPITIFIAVCVFLKNYYLKSQREITRLENITSSPIVSSFTEIMNGLPTIRAYQVEGKFLERQCGLVDINKKNRICKQSLDVWFSLRLSFLSYIVNITAIAFCVIGANDNPSLAGLLFAYSFTIDDYVVSMVYSLSNVETKMVSVERVTNFMNIEPEKGYTEYVKKWRTRDQEPVRLINQGRIEFQDLSLRYRESLPNVLEGLNMTIKSGEKIGVVGRTGAGKSTLILALLRTIEPYSGKIIVDGMDITSIPLKSLRSNLTLIAQEPVLIAGTLRQNLDPRLQRTDQQLTAVLHKCYLYQCFSERELLDTQISQSGQNLSIGQKQLICIARAILRQNSLVLIDEATANIDMKSDQLIQETIRKQFNKSTVITIAHRIKTILHSDRILVMDKGRIKEFDTPDNLLQRKGAFYEMYTKSREQNQL